MTLAQVRDESTAEINAMGLNGYRDNSLVVEVEISLILDSA
jgi:hypothetical protein